MKDIPKIKLYGADRCHKTVYYKQYIEKAGFSFKFLDVEINEEYAKELRGLHENGKLNFPTITIGDKKLRNPNDKELEKWLNKI